MGHQLVLSCLSPLDYDRVGSNLFINILIVIKVIIIIIVVIIVIVVVNQNIIYRIYKFVLMFDSI